jgi:hypothetical protein
MSLEGKIETVSLSGIFQLLCNESKTGILRITDDLKDFQVYFLDGNILYAIQSMKMARLGELLVKDNIISQAEINQCLQDAQKEKIALGKVLVNRGYITFQELSRYISKQILEILCEIFRWRSGEFSYSDINYNLKWLVPIRLSTLPLVMEAMRLVDEHNSKIAINSPV